MTSECWNSRAITKALRKGVSMPPNQTQEPEAQNELPPLNNAATIALLEQWAIDDATEDPAAIARANQDLAEFKAALNANRPPDRPVFP